MEATTLSKIVVSTDGPGSSSSPDFSPKTTVPMEMIEVTTSCDQSTSSPRVLRPNNISRPATPIPSTPVLNEDGMSTPIKRVLSLDLEMRSRKRRRGCLEEDCVIYYSSPTSSLRLPNLIPLEDCADSHLTCLPDTSFLRQKKSSLLRRRRRNVV